MLAVAIVGVPPTYNDFFEYWWPVVTGPVAFYSLAGLNLVAFICLLYDEKVFKVIRNFATYQNPDRIRSTPEFLRLKQLYDPEKGFLIVHLTHSQPPPPPAGSRLGRWQGAASPLSPAWP
jgi:hypothetical protein